MIGVLAILSLSAILCEQMDFTFIGTCLITSAVFLSYVCVENTFTEAWREVRQRRQKGSS